MRAYFICGLVSLSIAACGGNAALAQQPLWFTPQVLDSSPAEASGSKTTMWPEAPPSASHPSASPPSSLAQRFGKLLSKPGTHLAIAMGNEQAAIVTASGTGELSSPQPLGVPWASRDQERFSFAEIDSTDSQSLGTRGAQVRPMTPQVASHLPTQEPSTTSDAPSNKPVPWDPNFVAADTPVSNWPALDGAQMAPGLERPHRLEPTELQHRKPLRALLASAARPLGNGNDELSLKLPIPTGKAEAHAAIQQAQQDLDHFTPSRASDRLAGTAVPADRSMRPSRVAIVQQQASGGLPSASDVVPDAPQALRTDPPTISRITDKTNDIADKANNPAESGHASTGSDNLREPIKGVISDQIPLLSVDAMIGPLKGAAQLFDRLDLVEDLRFVAAPAPPGPREDASQFGWMPTPYTWISPAFYHYPLYFEQPNLERYGVGRARAVQPLLSAAHFFSSIPLVPYKTLTHHPRERVYTLGQGRPGNCVPVQRGVILGPSTVGEVSMFWEQGSGY